MTRRQANDLALALSPKNRAAVAAVHQTKAAIAEDLELWNSLLRNLLVLPYEDDSGVWYDWNPLIAEIPGGV